MELQKVVEKDLWLAQVPAVASALGSVVLLAREKADRLALALAGLSAPGSVAWLVDLSVLVRGLAMEQEEATLSALGSSVAWLVDLSVLVRGLAMELEVATLSAAVHIPGGM